VYAGIDAVRALSGTGEADRSIPGIVIAALSLAIMPFLSAAQRRAGRELGSASAAADSKQTLLCTYLSAVLLAGLPANLLLGWSWADPIAALVIAAVAVQGRPRRLAGQGLLRTPPQRRRRRPSVLGQTDAVAAPDATAAPEPLTRVPMRAILTT
jgi:hypothetical protein